MKNLLSPVENIVLNFNYTQVSEIGTIYTQKQILEKKTYLTASI